MTSSIQESKTKREKKCNCSDPFTICKHCKPAQGDNWKRKQINTNDKEYNKGYEQGYKDCFASVQNHRRVADISGKQIKVIQRKKEGLYILNIVKITEVDDVKFIEIEV